MNKHYLKILPEHYRNVSDGTKTFEIRKNDRAFQKGDDVVLQAFSPTKDSMNDDGYLRYISADGFEKNPDIEFKIGDVYPIDAERVVFSLLKHEVKI